MTKALISRHSVRGCDFAYVAMLPQNGDEASIIYVNGIKGGNPGDNHIVEYYAYRTAWFHIWLYHASPFADILGKSKFNNPAEIPALMARALTTKGVHQPNGNTAYVYEHFAPVGTLPNGTTTNFSP